MKANQREVTGFVIPAAVRLSARAEDDPEAPVLVTGQAPGSKVHESDVLFTNARG